VKKKELNFDLKQLRSFLEVLQENSFTRASRKLKIGQATISHHINQLEEMLGVILIERSSKTFFVTSEGKAFKTFCERLFNDIENLKIELDRGIFGGISKIASSTIPSTYILPGIIAHIKKENPDITYNVEISDSREAVELIKEGKAELAIVGKMIKHPSLNYMHIFSDEIVLVGNSDLPDSIGVDSLREMPLIGREKGSGTRNAYEKILNEHNIVPSELNIAFECSTSESVKESAISGIGAAFISKLAIKKELKLKSLKIIKIKNFQIDRNFYSVHLNSKHLTMPVKMLIKELEQLNIKKN